MTAILIYALEDTFGNKEILVANSPYDIVQVTGVMAAYGTFEFESDARHLKTECEKAGISYKAFEQTLSFFNGNIYSVDIKEIE